MKLTLMGPDDQGFWYLTDSSGRDFRIMGCWEEHAYAAKLFGWSPLPEIVTDDELNEAGRSFLMEIVGEQIEAPLHLAEHFQR